MRPCYGKDVAKITSKLQVTVPKRVAEQYRLKPGDEIVFEGGGDVIRVLPPGRGGQRADLAVRLKLFDQATERQRLRQRGRRRSARPPTDRGWTREELYERGRSR
jgi:AbrB family looped-hinge helix DNA binding protein